MAGGGAGARCPSFSVRAARQPQACDGGLVALRLHAADLALMLLRLSVSQGYARDFSCTRPSSSIEPHSKVGMGWATCATAERSRATPVATPTSGGAARASPYAAQPAVRVRLWALVARALRIGGLAARGLAAALPGGSDAFVRLSRRLHCVSRRARTARARCAPCMNAAKKHDHGVPGTRQHV